MNCVYKYRQYKANLVMKNMGKDYTLDFRFKPVYELFQTVKDYKTFLIEENEAGDNEGYDEIILYGIDKKNIFIEYGQHEKCAWVDKDIWKDIIEDYDKESVKEMFKMILKIINPNIENITLQDFVSKGEYFEDLVLKEVDGI